MNQYPLWRYLLVLVVTLVGAIYAAPNLFGTDPAIQISAQHSEPVDKLLQEKIEAALNAANIEPKRVELANNHLLFRFASDADRGLAMTKIGETIDGTKYTPALNLASATPEWLRWFGAKPMYMGLDLRGGVHFLMEVDTNAVLRQVEDLFMSELRTKLRDEKIRFRNVERATGGGLTLSFLNDQAKAQGVEIIKREFPNLDVSDTSGDFAIALTPKPEFLSEERKKAVKQNLTTLRTRINALGVAEPVIQQQGDSRIVVELPGIEDSATAKDLLGATATLEFHMVDVNADPTAAKEGKVAPTSKLYLERNGTPVVLQKHTLLTGKSIIDATSGMEQTTGRPAVFITLDGEGARTFARATRDQIGKPMAVVYIETKKGKVDEKVINVATIRDELGKRFQITGLGSTEEAHNLALLLRSGALAVPIDIIEERTIGPSLGQANIDRGLHSCVVGYMAVVIFMLFRYRTFGLIANLALALNVVLLVALLSMLQATLTLPGIAGILLTVGMAVDANVLINERIREELRNGNSPQQSINAGYERAFGTILDSNVTTFIAAIVLFSFGSGPVKGFAVVLSLGIGTSMFTAVTGTRAVVNLAYGRRRLTKLSV
ncbi:MAG: protein translocase subunit SecD [Gammaproteobacteria bacterium]|nr:protein translocase subunit SecD [Gammaproteobacteria bacterium]MBI5618563.1 protein translocase subunit SecD [Gammaproteobacteria bacterium]